ncbi:thyrotropin-releasing hormone receptor-like [Ruditapes philippinarum]|uniref:thyrotropin-releasing hormone receptor-like n=1 Tax=Ruditapes philippinarum TaxID=129788 RepID=UPI00295B6984|nr:thyrotropin-releasing hormone receptor-like [Ruditapes philippinarum]
MMNLEDYIQYKAALSLWRYVPPFLIVFGITGNVLTIIILLQKHLRNSATSTFLVTLAISDILALITGLVRQWVKYTFKVDIREDLTVTGCRIHWFVVYVVTQFSSWMLICVTLERIISTFLPHTRRVFCKQRNASIAVAAIFLTLCLLNSHYLFGYGDKYNGNHTIIERCVPMEDNYTHFISYSWTWIDLCVFYLIPMLFLLIGNMMIIFKVLDSHRRSRRAVVPSTNVPSTTATQRNKTSSLTVLLMLVSALFIICITPIVVYPIGEPYWIQGASEQRLATMFLSNALANLLMYSNHSVNFVLYFLSGSKFRSEVRKVISCKRRQVQVAPHQGTLTRSVSRVVS